MGMISLSTFSYDEMSKSNKYILTLPTNRKEIIKSKYILAIEQRVELLGIIAFMKNNIYVIKYKKRRKRLKNNYNQMCQKEGL